MADRFNPGRDVGGSAPPAARGSTVDSGPQRPAVESRQPNDTSESRTAMLRLSTSVNSLTQPGGSGGGPTSPSSADFDRPSRRSIGDDQEAASLGGTSTGGVAIRRRFPGRATGDGVEQQQQQQVPVSATRRPFVRSLSLSLISSALFGRTSSLVSSAVDLSGSSLWSIAGRQPPPSYERRLRMLDVPTLQQQQSHQLQQQQQRQDGERRPSSVIVERLASAATSYRPLPAVRRPSRTSNEARPEDIRCCCCFTISGLQDRPEDLRTVCQSQLSRQCLPRYMVTIGAWILFCEAAWMWSDRTLSWSVYLLLLAIGVALVVSGSAMIAIVQGHDGLRCWSYGDARRYDPVRPEVAAAEADRRAEEALERSLRSIPTYDQLSIRSTLPTPHYDDVVHQPVSATEPPHVGPDYPVQPAPSSSHPPPPAYPGRAVTVDLSATGNTAGRDVSATTVVDIHRQLDLPALDDSGRGVSISISNSCIATVSRNASTVEIPIGLSADSAAAERLHRSSPPPSLSSSPASASALGQPPSSTTTVADCPADDAGGPRYRRPDLVASSSPGAEESDKRSGDVDEAASTVVVLRPEGDAARADIVLRSSDAVTESDIVEAECDRRQDDADVPPEDGIDERE